MATRPRVFEVPEIEATLRAQGVPEGSIEETISFMRLVIPVVIRKAGADGIVKSFGDAVPEWELSEGRARQMAPYIEKWANACLDRFKADRAAERTAAANRGRGKKKGHREFKAPNQPLQQTGAALRPCAVYCPLRGPGC